MTQKKFHRHFPTKGLNLYWIIIAYLVIGAFYPIIGWIAIICMVAPVAFSVKRGRWWCGNACPRGNFFDRVLSRYSPHRPIPAFVRSRGWRIFMVAFIFTMFGVQMYYAWGNWAAMGAVFWRIILLTTIVAVVLAFIYAPRTWCSFCPMGTLSSWVAPKSGHLPDGYRGIKVGDNCTKKCKMCARVCPMQLNTYEARGNGEGFNHPDCIKCGKCTLACPMRACFHQYFPRLTDNFFSSGCRFHHLVGAVKDAHIKFFLQLCKH